MNRKTFIECLKLYPIISEEIKWREDNIKYFRDQKQEFINNGLESICDDIIMALDAALELTNIELRDLYSTKIKADYTLLRMNPKQKQLLQMRLWDEKSWRQIAKVYGRHRSSVEREFKKIIDEMLH
jgi:DNA-directed RNA polymerase specialized sigma subunit